MSSGSRTCKCMDDTGTQGPTNQQVFVPLVSLEYIRSMHWATPPTQARVEGRPSSWQVALCTAANSKTQKSKRHCVRYRCFQFKTGVPQMNNRRKRVDARDHNQKSTAHRMLYRLTECRVRSNQKGFNSFIAQRDWRL
eukprot:4657806-Pyramimonas_sp.AAC.1